ncbi:catalase family protein [Leptospira ellisii]|uniref:Catalase n=1 Tax=Leptospira ellisii TaxID=2023197 RepID=A0A2N0BKS6_9LEPT|nr:catalase family protein [Leptospira ellisii]MDV6234451.1 catalase family protein [Leptospira ellisii]PJZ92537.1 catalase [Leptospira ellisii]PKA04586.1 catalase [Leptospira ellisii]
MLKKIGYITIGILFLLGVLFWVGQGPRVSIPKDTKLGAEFQFPEEEKTVRETLDLLISSLKEKYPAGSEAKRDAHPFAHGCVKGKFTVSDSVPEELKYGIFNSSKTFPVWIRFSNGSITKKPDKEGDIRGMGIKLMGVDGPKLASDEKRTQDFLLINHPVLPAGDPAEYLALFRAAFAKKPMSYFFGGLPWNWKLTALRESISIRGKKIPDVLEIRYWSTTPYRLGKESLAVKYSAKPCGPTEAKLPENPGDDYLRQTMISHLKERSACFEFMIQKQTDPISMPVEDPAVHWNESDSPFQTVAKIEIPVQEFAVPEQDRACEIMSFNPWHSLPEHRPLGGINRVRKLAYETISKYRRSQNDVKAVEPSE